MTAARGTEVGGAVRTNVMLRQEDILFLSRLGLDIREKSGAIMERSAILRSLVAAVERSGIDLTGARTEEEMVDLLAQRLASGGGNRPKKSRRRDPMK